LDNIESYCDTSFDDQLLDFENINRLPWVGINYKDKNPKTLVLGESVYDWNPKDPSSIDRIYDSYNLRKLHKAHAFDFKRNSKFVRNIERAIYSKRRPTNEEKSDFWNSVVYHNLVNRVLKTKKHRPSYDDYYSGWKVFDKITSVFYVDQVIVYGLENLKIKAFKSYFKDIGIAPVQVSNLSKVGRSKPKKFIVEKGGKSISILFIRHPSAYFSWKKWSAVIHAEITVPSQIA
jgi:hypothetical protein